MTQESMHVQASATALGVSYMKPTNTNLWAQIFYFQLIHSQLDFYTVQGTEVKPRFIIGKYINYEKKNPTNTGILGGKVTKHTMGAKCFLHKLLDWAKSGGKKKSVSHAPWCLLVGLAAFQSSSTILIRLNKF